MFHIFCDFCNETKVWRVDRGKDYWWKPLVDEYSGAKTCPVHVYMIWMGFLKWFSLDTKYRKCLETGKRQTPLRWKNVTDWGHWMTLYVDENHRTRLKDWVPEYWVPINSGIAPGCADSGIYASHRPRGGISHNMRTTWRSNTWHWIHSFQH